MSCLSYIIRVFKPWDQTSDKGLILGIEIPIFPGILAKVCSQFPGTIPAGTQDFEYVLVCMCHELKTFTETKKTLC